ncbi:MAG: hypothetical protein PVH80_03410 [Anaerolineae bacterium]
MANLEDRHVAKAKELVFEKFPEMDGTRPSVSKGTFRAGKTAERTGSGSSSTGSAAGRCGEPLEAQVSSSGQRARYVVTFERDVPLPGGGKMKRLVRVTMDESGEVLKLVSSK